MVGAEYLRAETLARLWGELDAVVLGAMRAAAGGAAAWLAAQNPLWRQVGRVTFHLAENKRDPERPFAFLATYTHRLSEQAKPQYRPLGRALQEYAGAGNRAALLTWLAPVQRAAEQSAVARELVESQRVFQPQTWTAREAYRFLCDIALLRPAGWGAHSGLVEGGAAVTADGECDRGREESGGTRAGGVVGFQGGADAGRRGGDG